MKNSDSQIPWIVLETGPLLTLLLGGDDSEKGFAYTKLLHDGVRDGLFKLAIPDMVVSEIMNSSKVPLYQEEFSGKGKQQYDIRKVGSAFKKREERIELLKALLRTGNAQIVKTTCGTEFLEHIQSLLPYNKEFRRKKDTGWPPQLEELRQWLQSHNSLRKAVRQDGLKNEDGQAVSSGDSDRGEVAVADTIAQLQEQYGKETPIFALYEGHDLRARIIQRLSLDKETADPNDYHQWSGEALDRFNPNSIHFDRDHASTLGNINFLSTKGFLVGYMLAARDMSSERVKKNFYIVSPQEATSRKAMNDAYGEIIENVKKAGLSRHFKKYRDRHISETMKKEHEEYALANGKQQNAPWMNYIKDIMKDAEKGASLRKSIKKFQQYRDEALAESANDRVLSGIADIARISPEKALVLIEEWKAELKKSQKSLQR